MTLKNKILELLIDETFQDDIKCLDTASPQVLSDFLRKYSLTESEFQIAKTLFAGLTYKKVNPDADNANNALKRLLLSISETPVPNIHKKHTFQLYFDWVIRIAAILFIPLLISSLLLYFGTRTNNESIYLAAGAESVYNTFYAPNGVKSQVVLPDGSRVILNSGSKLRYPISFGPKSREVELIGEGFFDVVSNEKVPMIVNTSGLAVKVFGTRFNLNAYEENDFISATLVEGKVSLIPLGTSREFELELGYTALFNPDLNRLQISKVEKLDAHIGWMDGKLVFHNEKFVQIIDKLERWYNVDISLQNPEAGDFTLYATFMDENIEQVLDILSHSIPIKVEYPRRSRLPDGSYAKRNIVISMDANRRTGN